MIQTTLTHILKSYVSFTSGSNTFWNGDFGEKVKLGLIFMTLSMTSSFLVQLQNLSIKCLPKLLSSLAAVADDEYFVPVLRRWRPPMTSLIRDIATMSATTMSPIRDIATMSATTMYLVIFKATMSAMTTSLQQRWWRQSWTKNDVKHLFHKSPCRIHIQTHTCTYPGVYTAHQSSAVP